MELQFYGANCLRLNTKKAQLVLDDYLKSLGKKSVTKKGDIALFTTGFKGEEPKELKIIIDSPGEYEVSGVSIQGIAARSHMDEEGKKSATIFKILASDLTILVTGHIYPELNDTQLESIGVIDVMIVPVGGNGYTLDGVGARKLIKEIEPKLIIPTHYEEPGLNYEVPQQPLEEALKGLNMEVNETVSGKFKIKSGELGETTKLVILKSQ